MRINEMTLSQPVYNPEKGAFEAQARLSESGRYFTYRVRFSAAPHAEFDYVVRGLKTQALHMHRHAQARDISLHRAPVRSSRVGRLSDAYLTRAELRKIGVAPAA